jgi:hypothetical protein
MGTTRTTVMAAAFVAGVFSTGSAFAQARDLEAGPIWNQRGAMERCPQVCGASQATWNGQWRTTMRGRMSVCGCVPMTAPAPVVPPVAYPSAAATCAWPDGQDPAFPPDPGRGVSDWAAHYGFAVGGGRAQVPGYLTGRFEALRACLPPADFARLYADLSTQIAYYGRVHAGWPGAPDPRVSSDNGRGIPSWQAHLDFAMAPQRAAMAGAFVRQRLTDLNATLPVEAYARLYADASILLARFARAR